MRRSRTRAGGIACAGNGLNPPTEAANQIAASHFGSLMGYAAVGVVGFVARTGSSRNAGLPFQVVFTTRILRERVLPPAMGYVTSTRAPSSITGR